MTDPARKSYYQVSFTGVQALAGLVGLLAALALAFFLGAKAGFEKSTLASQPSVVPPGESESTASAPPAPTSTTIAAPPGAKSSPASIPAGAASTGSPATPVPPQEAPVFEDREAGVAAEQAPSRTEIAGEPARPASGPSSPKSSAKPAATPPAKPAAKSPSPKAVAEPEETSPASPKAAAGFYVQVISTTSKPEATRWKDKLSSKKYKPALSAVDSSKGKMYRIRLGPYADKEQARKLAAKISSEFHRTAWVAPAQ